MTPARSEWTDKRVERAVGKLLRIGVCLAAATVLAGGIWYLIRHGAELPDYRIFRGEPKELRSLSGALKFALELHSRGLIQIGLLLLVATPLARVVFSIAAFALRRDPAFVAVTLVVLAVLLYSLAGGGL